MARIDATVRHFACVWNQDAEAVWTLWCKVIKAPSHCTTVPQVLHFRAMEAGTNFTFMSKILIWPCQLFIGSVNKIKLKCLSSYFTDSGMFYTLWQELVWGFTVLHKYLYLKSAEFLFDRDSWTRLKRESSPAAAAVYHQHELLLIFCMFDLHTDDKPEMTAAVDEELRLVKGRQHNHMPWDAVSSD